MGKSKVYYLTAELNNATWILNKHKGHAFEDYIYGVVHNWCKTNYKGHCKIFQTPGSNDNGKDIILESDCSLNGFLGMSFQKQVKKVLKIYIECKSSDSNKIPYNSLAGNIKLSELDNITHYVLVTNTTITPYTLFMLQDEAQKRGFKYYVIDQFLLYRFLSTEHAMIGKYKTPFYEPDIHAEYQQFTESYGGKTRFSIYLLVRNYTNKIQSIAIQLQTDHNWDIDDDTLSILLDPGESRCHRMFVNKRFYDGLDDLCLSVKSDYFTKIIAVQGRNISHNFIPPLQGEEHRYIIDDIKNKIDKCHTLETMYLFGQTGTGKTRITDEIINFLSGTNVECLHISCTSKCNIYDVLKSNLEKITKTELPVSNNDILRLFQSFKALYGFKYVIFIDDIHNAPETFFNQIRLLSEEKVAVPVFLVLVGRNDFSEGSNAYFSFVNQCIQQQFPITGYTLKKLKESDVRNLIQSIVTDAPLYLIDKIEKVSNHIPLYVIQYLEYLLDIDLVKVINRNTVGVLNPETLSSHLYMPKKMETLYQKRIENLKTTENGEALVEFLFMVSLVGSEFNKKLFLNYFDNDENLLGLLIERDFLSYSYSGNITFAHESIYLYFSEFLKSHTGFRKTISKKILQFRFLFFDELKECDKGAIYCWAGDKKESLKYFNKIIQDIKSIDNYSSISLDAEYRPYMEEVYQTMYHYKFDEEFLKNALFSKVYLSLHCCTPYIAVQECDKIEKYIEKAVLIKDKETFKMALLEQKAHSYINMGQLKNSEAILQELLSKLIYNPDSMDNKTKFDLYDKMTNINLKYNNLSIAENYNKLAYKTAEKLEDKKLLALAQISYAKMHLYRDIPKAQTAIFQADTYLREDHEPRILCHNNLSKIVVALNESFQNTNVRKELAKDTQSLLCEAINGKYANSIIRGYLLLATIMYFEDLDKARELSDKGIDAGVRWGQANYMWHFYNLNALISIRKKEPTDYVSKLYNTVFHLLQKQNLLYLGELDFTYENILAISNVFKFWQKYNKESFIYKKLAYITYNNSAFSCNYNCNSGECNFVCAKTTEVYKKEYKKIKLGYLPFVDSSFSYGVTDPEYDYNLLFC